MSLQRDWTDCLSGKSVSVSIHGRTVSLPKTPPKPLREKSNFISRFNVIWAVQFAHRKYSAFHLLRTVPFSRHPASSKRGVRVVTIRGVRVAVDAMALRARGIAGRPQALSWGCERSIRAGRAAQFAYGKSVWFWHPWLVSSWRRLFESNRVR